MASRLLINKSYYNKRLLLARLPSQSQSQSQLPSSQSPPSRFYASANDPYNPINFKTEQDSFPESNLLGHKGNKPDGSDSVGAESFNTPFVRLILGSVVGLLVWKRLDDSYFSAAATDAQTGEPTHPVTSFLSTIRITADEARSRAQSAFEQAGKEADERLLSFELQNERRNRFPRNHFPDAHLRCSDRLIPVGSQVDMSDLPETTRYSWKHDQE